MAVALTQLVSAHLARTLQVRRHSSALRAEIGEGPENQRQNIMRIHNGNATFAKDAMDGHPRMKTIQEGPIFLPQFR